MERVGVVDHVFEVVDCGVEMWMVCVLSYWLISMMMLLRVVGER